MQVDLEDVLFWMDAVRNSDNKYRTLESFWKGQVYSKVWLIDCLKEVNRDKHINKIIIHGGWNGVLANLLFNALDVQHIVSVDIDPKCKEVANTVNKKYEMQGRFEAVTADMCQYSEPADVIINTSCEHITQQTYDKWLENQPDALLVVQSNNYIQHEEHIRCAKDIDEFTAQSKIKPFWRGHLELPKYKRWMIIGEKK